MKIALVQMNSVSDKAANLAAARQLVETVAAQEKPDWIALPEVWDFIGGSRADKFAAAEFFPDGPAYRLMAELAAKHGVFIHAGSILEKRRDQERLSNTTLAFDRRGREIARYRKIHMFDVTTPDGQVYRESASFAPGDGIATYEAEGFKIGCAICYDLRFPELFQALRAKDVDMIALPAAFTLQTGKDHWEVLARARAIETQTYFCAPAQWGPHVQAGETRMTYGHSLIVDPWGHVVARASDGFGFCAARLDRDQIAKVRALIPVQSHKTSLF